MNSYRLMALSMPDSLAREVTNQLNLFSLPSVLSKSASEPNSPFEGDAYIVPPSGWDGQNGNDLALFDGEQFIFLQPRLFTTVFVGDITQYNQWDGTDWIMSFPGLAAIALSGSASDLITGTVPPARLPMPTDSTLGAVLSIDAVAHQFLTSLGNDGAFTLAQPVLADISGAGTLAGLGVGNGLTSGGGNLSVRIGTGLSEVVGPLSVLYGTTAGTACQGNDSRLNNLAPYGSVTATTASTYTIILTDNIVEMNATAGAKAVVYPPALAIGKPVIISRSPSDSTSNAISISDGTNVVATISFPNVGRNLQSFTVYSDGSSLRVV